MKLRPEDVSTPYFASLAPGLRLLYDIAQAIDRGTKHFNNAEEELTTPLAVLQCLVDEGDVAIEATTQESLACPR
jgi:hypothetical protein